MKWKTDTLNEALNQILDLGGDSSTTYPTWESIFIGTQ